MVRDDLKAMKQRIRALVERTLESDGSTSSTKGKDASALQSHPLLQEAAREFFERRERAFRPAVVILVARALPLVAPEAEASIIAARQCLLAEIVEMMSTAQIIHDTVLEEDDDSALGNVAHRVYSSSAGNKVSVLAGDFLLARCSVALSQLGDLRVVELMAAALENMVHGNVLRRDVTDIASYEEATRLKTSSLVANACLSAAVLAGHHPDSDLARAVYAYADELGLAYQTVADVIIFDELSKNDEASRAHLLDFLPPVVYAPKKGNVQTGLRHALDAAKTHANNAISSLDPLPPSAEKLALLKMVDYVSERDQRGLQREKYIASAASPPRPATAAP
ncbi:hypothetical protein CTAYLR_009212 [Chrysophaeum taylorii]|uniref:Uncharacterized protein n=1 Tax=Chrysophaeum taylorii TaxID=2483200 RepID=A0AAD7UB79_9STRA|nr:hypothetical protein CTAYLR_009212 [Chrysophaeum taylorii]